MQFVKFEINNFKGIEFATLDLAPAGRNIFTLIGLNESGKTTILEALDDFGANREQIEALYGSKRAAEFVSFVPKHRKANFTGEITVSATVDIDDGEISDLVKQIQDAHSYALDPSSIPKRFVVTRGYRFENSDYKSRINNWGFTPKGHAKSKKKTLPLLQTSEAGRLFFQKLNALMPKIVYFPTFLFSIPVKIALNPDPKNETAENKLYRNILQDVANSLDSPLNIKTHVVDRMVDDSDVSKIVDFFLLVPDKQKQVNATLNMLSQHLTKTVFESWGRIFSGSFGGKEISLRLSTEASEDGKRIFLSFVLKDGPTEYDVSERSLGFRWFFSFLLFTQYRVFAKNSRGSTLFLLDEPASNLHSKAQMQLLDSFGRIADRASGIMYSTHSHYMINPEWLDQAFVVSNQAVDYDSPGQDSLSESRHTLISVQRYRSFVGQSPGKTTYFQPVLDRLDVVPSKLDLLRPSVLVEGKGDYLILEYGRRLLIKSKSNYAIVPTRGATDMDLLIGMFNGWGVNFVVCLDSDKAGISARHEYETTWGLAQGQVITLEDFDSTLTNCMIENLLTADDLKLVANKFGVDGKPSKSQIRLFFSEALAKGEKIRLSREFESRITALDQLVTSRLSSQGQSP